MSPESRSLRFTLLLAGAAIAAGCGREHEPQPGVFPRVGLAVSDSVGEWCAEFITDSTAPHIDPGQPMTIVFAGSGSVTTLLAHLGTPREGECPAAFPQPRWIDYRAYDVELLDPGPPGTEIPIVGLIVANRTSWARGPDGTLRADLDSDGQLEEVRRCTADEGEHWTVWSTDPGGRRSRRWHEYYDWGGFTDPTCGPGENGRDDPAPAP